MLSSVLMSCMHKIPPERAHQLAVLGFKCGVASIFGTSKRYPELKVETMGLSFPGPIGLAAGFDKNAEILTAMAQLGFGFVEAGTVTLKPQKGNPSPRLFRLKEDRAIINRMGFNNRGINAFVKKLSRYDRRFHVPVGANIGINKIGAVPERDYPALIGKVKTLVDYIVLNVSSPNTPGLRDLQNVKRLDGLLSAIEAIHPEVPPILVKLSPDLSEPNIPSVVETILKHNVQGLIVTNTTTQRPSSLRSPFQRESGGLSGPPLKALSTSILARIASLLQGRLTLVGSGGIENGQDVVDRIMSGADLVQIYTAFIYQGAGLIKRLEQETVIALRNAGFSSITEARGAALSSPKG